MRDPRKLQQPARWGLEVGLAARDLVDPDVPDEKVSRAYETMIARGADEPTAANTFLDNAKVEAARGTTGRRAAIGRYTDEMDRAKAASEEESGAQFVFRAIGDLAGAIAGGDPNQVSDRVRKIREEQRAKAEGSAGTRLKLELGQIDAEREDRAEGFALEDRERAETTRRGTAAFYRELYGIPEGIPDEAVNQVSEKTLGPERARKLQLKIDSDRRAEANRRADEREQRGYTEAENRRLRTVEDQRTTAEQNDARDAKQRRLDKSAELTRQVDVAASEVEAELGYMLDQIGRYGTQEMIGPFNDNMRDATRRIAVQLSKIADPGTAAMSGEVAREMAGMFEPGFWQNDDTVIARLKNLQGSIGARKERGLAKVREYEQYGFPDGTRGSGAAAAAGTPPPAGAGAPPPAGAEDPTAMKSAADAEIARRRAARGGAP